MLDGLATADDGGVLGNRAFRFFYDALGFFDQPFDCIAFFAGRLLADRFEDSLQCFDLAL